MANLEFTKLSDLPNDFWENEFWENVKALMITSIKIYYTKKTLFTFWPAIQKFICILSDFVKLDSMHL